MEEQSFFTRFKKTLDATFNRGSLCTRFNLAAAPTDFSPVTRHVAATVKEALAADQRVILLTGEEHVTIAHVRFAEIARTALEKEGIGNIAIACEQRHNFLESRLSSFSLPAPFFPDMSADFIARTLALSFLKKEDTQLYHKLQALAVAAEDWPVAPLTHHENFQSWLQNDVPVYLIDAALQWKGDRAFLDRTDPQTSEIIQIHAPNEKDWINAKEKVGLRVRNRFMMARIKDIMSGKNAPSVLIVQTGLVHLGGWKKDKTPYEESLHALLTAQTDSEEIEILTLLPEFNNGNEVCTFKTMLPAAAQNALNNKKTLLLNLADRAVRHRQDLTGSFAEESQALSDIYHRSGQTGAPPHLKDEASYRRSLAKTDEALELNLQNVTMRYVPSSQARQALR